MTDRVESRIDVPAEHMQNIFGSYDNYIRKIENDCKVTIINRDGTVPINRGEDNRGDSSGGTGREYRPPARGTIKERKCHSGTECQLCDYDGDGK